MPWIFVDKKISDAVAHIKAQVDSLTQGELYSQKTYSTEVVSLKKQIADLQINKDKMQEDHDRADRELRHMIGLEKKRQELEKEAAQREATDAKRAATLDVREENLAHQKDVFEDQMAFQKEAFDKQVHYLENLMTQILGRLPEVKYTHKTTEKLTGGKEAS
jgi:septal ring factor EnvC (AmiA/AmiB activator)